jgi:ketosteroid isomerase-like protein
MPESIEEQVLAANSAFYAAFARRDVAAMEALWARQAPVACVHPGWDALRGREAVMESWQAILASPRSPNVRFSNATAFVLGTAAFVVCTESFGEAELVATNVFVREDDAWRLAHHHAGPLAHPSDDEEDELPPSGMLN